MDIDFDFWLSFTSTLLYYAIYPLLVIVTWLVYVLQLLLSPFIYLAYVCKEAVLIPFRFLAKFEALWYFLGAAVLVGAFFGLALHFLGRVLVIILPDRQPAPKDIPPTGHDAVSYRAARQEKKDKELARQRRQATQARLVASQPLLQEAVLEARRWLPPPTPASASSAPLSPGTQRPSISGEVILEHTDEEVDDSIF